MMNCELLLIGIRCYVLNGFVIDVMMPPASEIVVFGEGKRKSWDFGPPYFENPSFLMVHGHIRTRSNDSKKFSILFQR